MKRQDDLRTWLILMGFVPFLCGFSFLSALKNEEGNKLYKKGQVGKAKNAYLSAQKSQPNSPEIAFNLGNAYYKEESFQDSLNSYKAAAKDERSPILQSKAFYNLGNNLFRRKELDKAKEFYKQALRINPKDEDAKVNLELLIKEQQDQKKDDQKQDKKEDKEDKKDQKDQKQDHGGGQGQQKDQQDKKDDQQDGGQSQSDKQDKDQDKKDQQNQNGRDDQENQKDEQGQKDQEKDQGKKPSEGEFGQSEQPKNQQQ